MENLWVLVGLALFQSEERESFVRESRERKWVLLGKEDEVVKVTMRLA